MSPPQIVQETSAGSHRVEGVEPKSRPDPREARGLEFRALGV